MWRAGGVRTYYRGLTLGLIGVFPYSAIDMGTYETLKTAYCRSTDTDEPPVFAVLSFGALSGSIGAASVYRKPFSLYIPTLFSPTFLLVSIM